MIRAAPSSLGFLFLFFAISGFSAEPEPRIVCTPGSPDPDCGGRVRLSSGLTGSGLARRAVESAALELAFDASLLEGSEQTVGGALPIALRIRNLSSAPLVWRPQLLRIEAVLDGRPIHVYPRAGAPTGELAVTAGGIAKTSFELGKFAGFVLPGRYEVKAVLVNRPERPRGVVLSASDAATEFPLVAKFRLTGRPSREDALHYCPCLAYGRLASKLALREDGRAAGLVRRRFDPEIWYTEVGAYAATREVEWPITRLPLPWRTALFRTGWLVCARPEVAFPEIEWAEEVPAADLERLDGQYDLHHVAVKIPFKPAD